MTQNDKLLHDAYIEWLLKNADGYTHAATLTLKPYRTLLTTRGKVREVLTYFEANRNFRLFLKRLNISCFGNAAKRNGKTLTVLPMLHGIATDKLLHYHCALGNFPSCLPNNAIQAKITAAWHQTPFGNEHVVVKSIYSSGWVSYMGKEICSRNTVAVDVENTRLPTASLT